MLALIRKWRKKLTRTLFFVAFFSLILTFKKQNNIFLHQLPTSKVNEPTKPSFPVDVVYTWVNGSDPSFLRDLQRAKDKRAVVKGCPHKSCVESHLLIINGKLPQSATLDYVIETNRHLKKALALSHFEFSINHVNMNKSALWFKSNVEARQAWQNSSELKCNDVTYDLTLAYWTVDGNVEDSVQVSSFIIASNMKRSLLRNVATNVNVWMYERQRMAVIRSTNLTTVKKIIAKKKKRIKTYSSDKILISSAYLLLKLSLKDDDSTAFSRFSDFDQLKYSMRSLEKFAPWVNHVFLVTNGQLPVWLNRQHAKLKIVTHKQIFEDLRHLPTFSSNAIEANINRIPSLSDKYLIMNDDILLGQQVSLGDFLTEDKSSKIRLAWQVPPPCAKNCQVSLLRNGHCDPPCNVKKCLYDKGDCKLGWNDPTLQLEKPRLFDTFTASIQHSNFLFDREYGRKLRYVPMHTPYLIDRNVMRALTDKFAEDFRKTSSHSFREWNDLVLSFAYAYFLMSEKENLTIYEIFGKFDRDGSSSWSEEEMKSLLDKTNDMVFSDIFLERLLECPNVTSLQPLDIKRETLAGCPKMSSLIESRFANLPRYKYRVVFGSTNVAFYHLSSSVEEARIMVDELVRQRRKFICINDDTDSAKAEETKNVQEMVRRYYESVVPEQSNFELGYKKTPSSSSSGAASLGQFVIGVLVLFGFLCMCFYQIAA